MRLEYKFEIPSCQLYGTIPDRRIINERETNSDSAPLTRLSFTQVFFILLL